MRILATCNIFGLVYNVVVADAYMASLLLYNSPRSRIRVSTLHEFFMNKVQLCHDDEVITPNNISESICSSITITERNDVNYSPPTKSFTSNMISNHLINLVDATVVEKAPKRIKRKVEKIKLNTILDAKLERDIIALKTYLKVSLKLDQFIYVLKLW